MPGNEEPQSSIVLYQTEDGRTRIQCRFENETIWLTQKLMAELFKKDVRTINEHIQNVISECDLAEESVIRKFRITAADGKSYDTQHYNLEVVIAVGYRVKSPRGAQFRQWATARLSEYLGRASPWTTSGSRTRRARGRRIISMSCWSASGTSAPRNELSREAVIRKFRIARREGTREVASNVEHYSLEVRGV